MRMKFVLASLLGLSFTGCSQVDSPEKAPATSEVPAPQTADPNNTAAKGSPPELIFQPADKRTGSAITKGAPIGSASPSDPNFIKIDPAPPLTSEEQALIGADPKDLSTEQRIARSHALRKKIMQHPDSPQAQTLLQGAKMLREGTITVPTSSELVEKEH